MVAGAATMGWFWYQEGKPTLPKQSETIAGVVAMRDLPPGAQKTYRTASTTSPSPLTQAGVEKNNSFLQSPVLPPKEIAELFKFLAATPKPEATADRQKINAQKESTLRALDDHVADNPDILNGVIRLLENKEADLVGRDYAAQHSIAMYTALVKRGGWTDDGLLKNALQKMLNERESTLAGTALLSLRTLAKAYPEKFDLQLVEKKSVEIARDETASVLSRTTALKVAAEQGETQVLPLARQWANQSETATQQIAAIAALGNLGDQNDYNWLTIERGDAPYWLHASLDRTIKILSDKYK